MYTPDRGFVKKLKEYDRQLEAVWNAHKQRWQIYRIGLLNQAYHICTVKNDDGSFRPLDERVLHHLKMCDTWARRNPGDISDEIDQYNAQQTKLREDERRDFIRNYVDTNWSRFKKMREDHGSVNMSKETKMKIGALEESSLASSFEDLESRPKWQPLQR